ncbi:MAG: GNAT family N-acetyltransferase [Chloroflexota bacterium]
MNNHLVQRIQAYLQTRYLNHDVIRRSPFTIFLHRTDDCTEASTAVPDINTYPHWPTSLAEVKEAFAQHGRCARVEFLDTFAPTLIPALTQAGFVQTSATTVVMCTPETYRPAPTMPGLSSIILSRGLAPEEIDANLQTRELGFDPFNPQIKHTEAGIFKETLMTDRAFLLRLHRQPVAVGMFAEINEGVTELVGVTTLPEFRRRGFAAYLTGYMTQVAFARHVDLAFIICEDDDIANMYRHVGYKPCATLLSYEIVADES